MYYSGDYPTNGVVYIPFDSFAAATGAPTAVTNFAAADIQVYKDGGTTQRSSSAGITVSTSFDTQTGLQMIAIDTSDNTDAGFYAAGHEYQVAVADITVDAQTLRFWAATFSIERAGGALALLKATGSVKVDAVKWNGTTVATPATAGIPDINVKNMNNVAATPITTIKAVQGLAVDGVIPTATAVTTVNGLAANVITATAINAAAFSAAKFAADTGLVPVRSATAQAGAATTITLDASASAVDNFYLNDLLYIVSGTGAGQARFISGYVGSTKVATVTTWATNPDNTSVFAILPSDGTTIALPTNFSSLSIDASGRVDVIKLASQTVTAAAGVTFPASVASPTNITAGTIATVTNLTNAPTAGDFTATMKTSIGTAVAASAVASVTGAVGSVTGLTAATVHSDLDDIQARLPAALTANGNIKADTLRIGGTVQTAGDVVATANNISGFVDTEIGTLQTALNAVLALLDDPRGELAQGAPPVNPDAMTKLDYIYMSWRNLKTNDGTTTKLFADNGTTVVAKQATSQAAGTVSKAEWVTGP